MPELFLTVIHIIGTPESYHIYSKSYVDSQIGEFILWTWGKIFYPKVWAGAENSPTPRPTPPHHHALPIICSYFFTFLNFFQNVITYYALLSKM